MTSSFATGSLIAVRGREWVVVEALDEGALSIRPLGGLDDDAQVLFPALEHDLKPATFACPASDAAGPSAEARLLRESLHLNLRRGAGPFRSFGRLAFELRAYQLAPLLMALKLGPIPVRWGGGLTCTAGKQPEERLPMPIGVIPDEAELRRIWVRVTEIARMIPALNTRRPDGLLEALLGFARDMPDQQVRSLAAKLNDGQHLRTERLRWPRPAS